MAEQQYRDYIFFKNIPNPAYPDDPEAPEEITVQIDPNTEEGQSKRVAINTIKHSDVYLATHDGEGNRLPYCERSFISFTYGGRHIEDFGAIAVTEGDRWSHPMYAEFSDITNNPEVYDGQLYWDTHHGANTWELQLSTDCMTEQNLNDFKNWFKPGVIRELILAEHPNRAIMARISGTPSMSVLPFEEREEVLLGSNTYTLKTTVYKGEISISFVMDYPFWYAKCNTIVLPSPDIAYADNSNYAAGTFCVEDGVKIIYEDNLIMGTVPSRTFIGDEVSNSITIAGVGESTPSYGYLYYAGIAPCKPIIEFDLTPRLSDNTTGYIDSPHNSIGGGGENPYNYIRFESENSYDLNITTAGIYSSYNYARQILADYATGVSWEELRVAFRNYIKHANVRAYMMRLVDKYRSTSNSEVVTAENVEDMEEYMVNYLYDPESTTTPPALAAAHYEIDCETGRARITVNHCTLTYDETQDSWTTNYSSVTEDAGDMLKSKYLKLEDRNYLLDNHTCGTWDITHKQYAYRISTNFPELNNFKVSYKNMYY